MVNTSWRPEHFARTEAGPRQPRGMVQKDGEQQQQSHLAVLPPEEGLMPRLQRGSQRPLLNQRLQVAQRWLAGLRGAFPRHVHDCRVVHGLHVAGLCCLEVVHEGLAQAAAAHAQALQELAGRGLEMAAAGCDAGHRQRKRRVNRCAQRQSGREGILRLSCINENGH